jgi:hypothetical protein
LLLVVEQLEDAKSFQIINGLDTFKKGSKKFVYNPIIGCINNNEIKIKLINKEIFSFC